MTRPGSQAVGALSDCPTIRRREGARSERTDTIVAQKITRPVIHTEKRVEFSNFFDGRFGLEIVIEQRRQMDWFRVHPYWRWQGVWWRCKVFEYSDVGGEGLHSWSMGFREAR